jgi:hypothetical protein
MGEGRQESLGGGGDGERRDQGGIGRGRVERALDTRGQPCHIVERHQAGRGTDELAVRGDVGCHYRHRRGDRLDRREPEALEPAGAHRNGGLAIGAGDGGVVRVGFDAAADAEPPGEGLERASLVAPADQADADRVSQPRRGLDHGRLILVRAQAGHGEQRGGPSPQCSRGAGTNRSES